MRREGKGGERRGREGKGRGGEGREGKGREGKGGGEGRGGEELAEAFTIILFAELVEEMGKLADEQLQLLEKQVEEEERKVCMWLAVSSHCAWMTFDPTGPSAWHAETSGH